MASPHRIPFRTFLWEYLGHPDEETPERRRILYAIVVLRCGFALLFLLRGWSAVFATSPDAFATRLGDPARLGLGGTAVDTILFILGCTELGIGALLFFGAFTRVSAVTGLVLALLSLILGQRRLFPPPDLLQINEKLQFNDWFKDTGAALNVGALIGLICGLALVVICGAPFLSADRALDKLEEEERDRAPARLPQFAEATPILLRLGLALPIWWYALWSYAQGPGNSIFLLVLQLLLGVPLLLGVWTRIMATPFVLALVLAVVDGGRGWSAMEWLLPAVPTVAIALLITGPGSLRVGQWPFRNRVAAAEAREAAGK
ncbi:MAG: DoxX family membrane protein [Thermomicrobiales bacterium]